ncbi:T6SS effector amidase Tae4 family protein [Taibaiella sp. KBW10]|uniref:T6SS effector amidase Tae4 family protein n=1 Tax=Taibaiella sp. KBW10 TaxID=2153357 RepID=UPI00131596E1|nr:T6SS effector amidase Tae4 family protein [Taibaiella sp. KBW10]
MSKSTFPAPSQLMAHYPATPSEHCNRADNECGIRMSITLHKNKISVSGSSRFRETHSHTDGIVHQPSAQALADWLSGTDRLGAPKEYKHPTGQWKKIDFITKNGIIYFAHPNRGGDGPGHIDVISNGVIGSGFYDNKLIYFWEYIDGKYIANHKR